MPRTVPLSTVAPRPRARCAWGAWHRARSRAWCCSGGAEGARRCLSLRVRVYACAQRRSTGPGGQSAAKDVNLLQKMTASWRVLEASWRVLEAARIFAGSFRKVSGSSRKLPRGFWKLPGSFREASGSLTTWLCHRPCSRRGAQAALRAFKKFQVSSGGRCQICKN
jgi:hypothetical protein